MNQSWEQSEESFVGRRKHARLRLRLPARLVTTQSSSPATILNLAEHGVGINTDAFLKVGFDVVLKFMGLELFCQVVWARQGFAGLRFDATIGHEIILLLREVGDKSIQRVADLEDARAWVDGSARFNSSD